MLIIMYNTLYGEICCVVLYNVTFFMSRYTSYYIKSCFVILDYIFLQCIMLYINYILTILHVCTVLYDVVFRLHPGRRQSN